MRNNIENTKVIVGEGASGTGEDHGEDYSVAGCPSTAPGGP